MSSTFQFNRLRGCSVAFGYLAVRRFLDNNDLMCVIRAHAVQEDGYYRHFEKALKRRDVGKPERACLPASILGRESILVGAAVGVVYGVARIMD